MRNNTIAIYLPSLQGGGAERAMATLANGFADRGYPVDLVLAKAEGPYLKDINGAVRIIDLKAQRTLTSLPGLVRYLRHKRPAAILSALTHANIIAVAARFLARVQTEVIISERSTFSISCANAEHLRGKMIGNLVHWVYPNADRIIAISHGVANDLIKSTGVPESLITVIYNPVVHTAVNINDNTDHPWFTSGMPPVVLGVGRLTPAKNFPLLLNAFSRVRAQRCSRLMILGEGELRPELEKLISKLGLQDSVSLPGFVTNPYAYMRRAAMFVLSSSWEGFGNVLVEAMACGTPVVSTHCQSGPSEILEDGKWGRLVPPDHVEALADAIIQTLDAPTHPDVGKRAADFRVEIAVNQYLAALGMTQ